MPSAEQMTIKRLTSLGWIVGKVTYFNAYSKTHHDLFGIFDLIGISPCKDIVGIQVTKGMNNKTPRVQKIKESEIAKAWLAKGLIYVITWRKLKQKNKDGKKGKREVWTPDIEEITL